MVWRGWPAAAWPLSCPVEAPASVRVIHLLVLREDWSNPAVTGCALWLLCLAQYSGIAGYPLKGSPVKLLSTLLHAALVVLLLVAGSGEAAAQVNTQVNLTTSVIGGGSIVRDPDQTFYDIGATVSLAAIADDGFVFQAWSGPVADPLSDSTTILLKSNTLVTATFVSSGKPALKTNPEAGTPLDFGVVETGLLSIAEVRTILVTNSGGGTLEGTAAVRAGTSRPYGVLSGGSFSLAASQSAEVRVVFDPFNVDLNRGSVPVSDVLIVTSNGGNAEIPLTGVAIASGELACSCATVAPGGKPWGDTLLLLATVAILAVVRRSPALVATR